MSFVPACPLKLCEFTRMVNAKDLESIIVPVTYPITFNMHLQYAFCFFF